MMHLDSGAHSGSAATALVLLIVNKLFDSIQRQYIYDQVITVDSSSGIILSIQPFSSLNTSLDILLNRENCRDLRGLTVLPGFVDAHVHFFLHPYSETSWNDQVTKESIVERTIRATNHAKSTLMAGFTTVRDLGTEGAGDADIHLRKCMSGPKPLIPGPRYFCANRAIVATGCYGPKSDIKLNNDGVDGVTGAEVADGRDGCMTAVRRQISAGADWIKVYADYSVRTRHFDVSPYHALRSIRTFNREELEVMINTAHQYGVKVAAHTTNHSTIIDLLSLGVDSIEHGFDLLQPSSPSASAHVVRNLFASKTTWVPTLAAYYTSGGEKWEHAKRTFEAIISMPESERTMNIACGGDTGVFPHGENALEMKLMVRLGASWKDVLAWATIGGYTCVRPMDAEEVDSVYAQLTGPSHAAALGDNDVKFGVIKEGWAADIIALDGDPELDFEAAVDKRSVRFVMKGGVIFKS